MQHFAPIEKKKKNTATGVSFPSENVDKIIGRKS